RTAGPPAASLSPSGGSCRGRRGAHVHRPTAPGRSSPPVRHETLHPSVITPRKCCGQWPSVAVLVRAVVDRHHAHPVNRLRSLPGGRGFTAQGRLHLGPPFGGEEGPHHLDDAAHVGQHAGAVHGALVLAGDLVELEGGFHGVAVTDGSVLIDKGLVALHHDGFKDGQWGDRGRHTLDEIDAVFLCPALQNLAVGGTDHLLNREVASGVVADRV